mmetsp:Transcript_8945/g.10238  ORF Transcript_8945/g.10238 Transcript_8945/m.10238 type:complete len:455 (+) Transcript_8945:129-1493(+)
MVAQRRKASSFWLKSATPKRQLLLLATFFFCFSTYLYGHFSTSQLSFQLQSTLTENSRLRYSLQVLEQGQSERVPKNESIDRVYCMVPTIYTSSKFQAWSVILRTWGRKCDVLKFFVEPQENGNSIPEKFADPGTGYSADIVVVPMVRKNDPRDKHGNYITKSCWAGGGKNPDGTTRYAPCRHIWEKVWRSWVYIAENDIDSAEWFLKVDDDTYLFPDNLKRFIKRKGWSHTQTHYFGHRLFHSRKTVFVAGTMVGYSRRTLQLAAEKYKTMPKEYGDRSKFKHGRCVDRDGATQELPESICLRELGIHPEPTHDINGFEKQLLDTVPRNLLMRKKDRPDFWYWRLQSETAICCSTEPISLHPVKKPNDMMNLHQQLFNASSTGLRDLLVNYDLTAKFRRDPSSNARVSSGSNFGGLYLRGRSARDLYIEIQWYLQVRDSLDSNGLLDPIQSWR